MAGGNTDEEWEKWGKRDPYFGVLTNEKYRYKNLTDEARKEFFDSGRAHIRSVLAVIRRVIDPDFSPDKILDFGCGVGRLVIPFSEIAQKVVGLDISESMLKEAERNCNKYSITNISLLKSDDELSVLDGKFDLIHSYIVFQHIPVMRGLQIFTKLIEHLENGGVCTVQFIYSHSIQKKNYQYPPLEIPSESIRMKLAKMLNIKQSNTDQDPSMIMNLYSMDEIFFLLHSMAITNIHVEFTDHDGVLGCFLYFRKPNKDQCRI